MRGGQELGWVPRAEMKRDLGRDESEGLGVGLKWGERAPEGRAGELCREGPRADPEGWKGLRDGCGEVGGGLGAWGCWVAVSPVVGGGQAYKAFS